ncbi:MAG: hypothetical protein WBY53_17165, partial [Acidobacteriaceae bacterium]
MIKSAQAKHALHAHYLSRTLVLTGVAALLAFGFVGCKSSSNNAATTAAINNGTAPATSNADPADSNLAPASGNTQVMGASSSYTPQQQGESYPSQSPAPVVQGYNNQDQSAEQAGEQAMEQPEDQTNEPPPPLPDYDQPPAPDPNYIWTPGYWAWGPGGYYWVPGEWVEPPYYGALWTPPYWGYENGEYGFYPGYWGPYVGYYGGIDYGFGYIGIGYFGGYWHGNNFYYNRAVTNVGRGGYTYDHAVEYNHVRYNGHIQNRISYNGGHGGINVHPRPSELAAMHMTHTRALPSQRQSMQEAAKNHQQFYSANHGKPQEFASAKPVAGHGIEAAPAAVRNEQQHAEQQRAAMAQHANTPEQHGAAAEHGAVNEQHGAPAARGETQHNAPAAEHNNARPTEQRSMEQHNEQHNAPAAEHNNARPAEQHAAPAQRAEPAR